MMYLYEIKSLRDDKKDSNISTKESAFYASETIEPVIKKALEMSKNLGDEIDGIVRHVPILSVLTLNALMEIMRHSKGGMMYLYEIKSLKGDKKDSNIESAFYASETIEPVIKKALEMSKNLGDEIEGIVRHVPILSVLAEEE